MYICDLILMKKDSLIWELLRKCYKLEDGTAFIIAERVNFLNKSLLEVIKGKQNFMTKNLSKILVLVQLAKAKHHF